MRNSISFRIFLLIQKWIFLFLIVLVNNLANAQTVFEFEVTSLKTGLSVPQATISLYQNRILAIEKTDINGRTTVRIDKNGKINVAVNHPDFESFDRTLELDDDTISFKIQLKPSRIQEVKEVVIKAPGAVDTVFGSERLSVEDFEVLNNGNLMLLTYPKRLKKGSEIQLYDGQKVLNSFPVPGRALHLEKDYRGNVHVVCQNKVFTVMAKEAKIQIAQLDKAYYYRYVSPILDTNGYSLYYSDFNKNYPEFSFWSYDQIDSTYDKLRTIRDDLMMELYRAEYKWVDVRTKLWAKNLEYQTGIDAEIWVGANYFTQTVYYKELYAPFFKVKDKFVVFDYYKDLMYRHELGGGMLDSVEINHHLNRKKTGFKNELIQDKATGNVYAWYEKAGTSYLGKINLKTGEVPELYQLNFRYLQKIEVCNGFVYYVYRPFESPQKKFLYKEKLPKEFTEN